MDSRRKFPSELWRNGDPELRPEQGRWVLTSTRNMLKLEKKRRGRAVVATVAGCRPPISLEDVVAALKSECGVEVVDVKVDVAALPADFFIRFRHKEDCSRVVHRSWELYISDAPLQLSRWHPASGAEQSELSFLCKLTFERFPRQAWEPDAVGQLVNQLGGHLKQMLVPTDSWFLCVEAWMKDPCDVPLSLVVEVPMARPPLEPTSMDYESEEDPTTPSPPSSPMSKKTATHTVLIHVSEVLDGSPVITDLPLCYQSDEDPTRTHFFPFHGSRLDGSVVPPDLDGGHFFGGHNGYGSAGGD